MALLTMAIYAMLFENRYTVLRSKEPTMRNITNFSFKVFKIMRFLKSSKRSKTTDELTFTARM